LIRVAILADSASRASGLAEVLAEDERIEVLQAGPLHSTSDEALLVDVLVATGIGVNELPGEVPTVLLEDSESTAPEGLVRAVLPLNASAAEIVAAVVAAAAELTVLTQAQVRRLFRGRESMQRGALVEPLTPRELQVLRMLADGLGNKEIANRLGISDHTAKFHVTQILGKLGAGSRTEAVAIAIRRGLVPI
jgi:DNA-binding CsgD family transcriptional regulator